MFLSVTIITLITIFVAGGAQDKPLWAAYTLFLPFWWSTLLIYILWSVVLLNSFINPVMRLNMIQCISRVGGHANMHTLNIILFIGACILTIVGGRTTNANMFIAGVIVVLGLIGNAWEQRSII